LYLATDEVAVPNSFLKRKTKENLEASIIKIAPFFDGPFGIATDVTQHYNTGQLDPLAVACQSAFNIDPLSASKNDPQKVKKILLI